MSKKNRNKKKNRHGVQTELNDATKFLSSKQQEIKKQAQVELDAAARKSLTRRIIKMRRKRMSISKIAKKTGLTEESVKECLRSVPTSKALDYIFIVYCQEDEGKQNLMACITESGCEAAIEEFEARDLEAREVFRKVDLHMKSWVASNPCPYIPTNKDYPKGATDTVFDSRIVEFKKKIIDANLEKSSWNRRFLDEKIRYRSHDLKIDEDLESIVLKLSPAELKPKKYGFEKVKFRKVKKKPEEIIEEIDPSKIEVVTTEEITNLG